MNERQIPRCFRTLISDRATNQERKFIWRFIGMCTGSEYSATIIRRLDGMSDIAVVEMITTEDTYSVIRSQLSDLYPGLCVFDALGC